MIPVITPLLAVLLPIFVMAQAEKRPVRNPYLFSVCSMLCGFGAVFAELYTIKKRVLAGDMGGIEDTIDAVLLLCGIIIAATVLLNLFALGMSYHREKGNA